MPGDEFTLTMFYEDSIATRALKDFATVDLSVENIDFLLEAKTLFEKQSLAKEELTELINKFIKDGAQFELNLSSPTRAKCEQALEKKDTQEMQAAIKLAITEIEYLVTSDTIPKFIQFIHSRDSNIASTFNAFQNIAEHYKQVRKDQGKSSHPDATRNVQMQMLQEIMRLLAASPKEGGNDLPLTTKAAILRHALRPLLDTLSKTSALRKIVDEINTSLKTEGINTQDTRARKQGDAQAFIEATSPPHGKLFELMQDKQYGKLMVQLRSQAQAQAPAQKSEILTLYSSHKAKQPAHSDGNPAPSPADASGKPTGPKPK